MCYLSIELHPDDWVKARGWIPDHGGHLPISVEEMREGDEDNGIFRETGVVRIVEEDAGYGWSSELKGMADDGVRFIAFSSGCDEYGDDYRVSTGEHYYTIPALYGEGPAYPVNKNGVVRQDCRDQARSAMRAMTKIEILLNTVRENAAT